MSSSFGPWTTSMTMTSPQGLSTFWKRRLTMLHPTSRSPLKLGRVNGFAVVAAAIVTCLLPTLRLTWAQAASQEGQAKAASKGRLYVNVALTYKPEGKDEETQHNLIIAIDPATGKWQKITDSGHAGRVSPDGQTVVFSRFENGQEIGIWNCDTQGSNNPGKVSDRGGRPIWSPDGKHLVATKQELLPKESEKKRTKPAWKDETWKMDADGRNPVKLPIPDTDSVEDWSPDGQWFVTCSDRHAPYGSGYQLYVMKTDGAEQRRLTQGGLNCYARFSPDGKRIVYIRQTAKAGNSVWVVDVDGKNARELLKEENLATPNGAFWSPDGKQLAVSLFNWELDENGRRTVRDPANANHRIEIIDVESGNRRELPLEGAKLVFVGSLGDWR
jgi:Tol biopolymer transport system component